METGEFPGHRWVTVGHGPPQIDYEDEKDAEDTVPRGKVEYSQAIPAPRLEAYSN